MIEQRNTIKRTVYLQKTTNNQSFLQMHYYLRDIGIKNNAFFLILFDPDLDGVDPRDPRLNLFMKQKILAECMKNYWYFIREVIRVPESGGAIGSGKKYELNRGNLALNYGFMFNWNMFFELPRQRGKTVSILCRLLWEFLYGTTNSQMSFFNKKHEDSKLNLQRFKEIRAALPSYLQMSESYGVDGQKLKAPNSVETLQHPRNGNKIKTLPAARNKTSASSLGRGETVPRLWFDEYAFTLFNSTIYMSAVPGYKTASINAKRNNAPYGILISTTPGDMTTDEGMSAFKTKEAATPFSEEMYDMSYERLSELLAANTNSSFVYIRFSYQQLGCSEEWFKQMVIDMEKRWPDIRREVLLEWSTVTDNSPFSKEDLNIVKGLIREPIKTMYLANNFPFNIYEYINLRFPPIIGVDVSGGYLRDSSAITVIDSRTTNVCADMNCNYISPIDLARVIYELVTSHMPNAVVNIERNGGFGASVIAKLKTTKIKRNLYYEIKDKVTEERFNGSKAYRTVQKTKVYGLDSTKAVRDILIEILRERMELHKDKFVSPIIYRELETLEVKRNGKVEHSANGHDDQIFSYLMALYVWYEGTNLKENYGIIKRTIKTDQELDEDITPIETKYDGILNEIETSDDDMVNSQLKALEMTAISHQEWRDKEYQKDRAALEHLLSNDPNAVKAYEEKYSTRIADKMESNGLYEIPDEVFNLDYNDDTFDSYNNLDQYYTESFNQYNKFM